MKILIFLFIFVSCHQSSKSNEEFNRINSVQETPSEDSFFDETMYSDIDLLPLKGSVQNKNKLWSGNSWRLLEGAINLRWNSPDLIGFNYNSPSINEIFRMSKKDIEELSPTEKYDIYMGNYHFPLKQEVDSLARNGIYEWEGICHGWAAATIHHDEPEPKTVINPDGIEVFFGSSDIKALLSYAYSKVILKESEIIGKRCGYTENEGLDFCLDDLNPASFHVVITNKIGLKGESVILDVDHFNEVWNHPITDFETKVLKMYSSPEGRIGIFETTLEYVEVVEKNSWERQKTLYGQIKFNYKLEMDQDGNIRRGKWLSFNRPGFMWSLSELKNLDDYLSGVTNLL